MNKEEALEKSEIEVITARNNLEAITLNCAAQFIVSAFNRLNMRWDGELIDERLPDQREVPEAGVDRSPDRS